MFEPGHIRGFTLSLSGEIALSGIKGRRPKFPPTGLQQADAAGEETKEAFFASENLGADSALATLAPRTPSPCPDKRCAFAVGRGFTLGANQITAEE